MATGESISSLRITAVCVQVIFARALAECSSWSLIGSRLPSKGRLSSSRGKSRP